MNSSKEKSYPPLGTFLSSYDREMISWRDIPTLGSSNISYILAKARKKESLLSSKIVKIAKKKEEIEKGISLEKILQKAKKYEDPTGTYSFGISEKGFFEIEPTDAASLSRSAGSTTFNVCGWCKHNKGIVGKYNFRTQGSCSLLHSESPTVSFDTPCLLKEISESQKSSPLTPLNKDLKDLKDRREDVREGIRILLEMRNSSVEEKPTLPFMRSSDHFNVGDEVIIYVGNYRGGKKNFGGEWTKAIVIPGYRHHAGYVTYQMEFPLGDGVDSRRNVKSASSPEILHKKDFENLYDMVNNYHIDNYSFITIWARGSSEDPLTLCLFINHLTTSSFVVPNSITRKKRSSVEVLQDAYRLLEVERGEVGKAFSTSRAILRRLDPTEIENRSEELKKWAEEYKEKVKEAIDLILSENRKVIQDSTELFNT